MCSVVNSKQKLKDREVDYFAYNKLFSFCKDDCYGKYWCKSSCVLWCLFQKKMQFVEIKSVKMLDVFLASAVSHQLNSLHPTWS